MEDQIINFMLNLDRPVKPLEIAQNINRNPDSVRSLMSRLLRKGIVKKIRYGTYSLIEGYGIWGRSIPLRFQNLHFLGKSDVKKKDSGNVDVVEFVDINGEIFRIRIVYGFTHGQISWTVKAPIGLDYYGLMLASLLVECKIAHRGYFVSSWMVRNFETLQDHMGLRVESLAKSVTLDDLAGNLLKIYQKSYGVRVEVRSQGTTSLETLLALSTGGMPQAQLMQGLHRTNAEIFDLTQALKYRNVDDNKRDRLLEALAQNFIKMNETVHKIAKKLEING